MRSSDEIERGGWPTFSPHQKAGALPFSRSLREGGAFDRWQNRDTGGLRYSDWAFIYEPQNRVDAGLVAAAGPLEPFHNIMANPDGQTVFVPAW